MKHIFSQMSFALFFCCILLSKNSYGNEKGQFINVASYQIDVRLDTQKKELWGEEIISFRNCSDKGVDTLFLHLYPNAFKSDSTTLMRESLFPDHVKKKEKYRGFVSIEKVSLRDGLDLTEHKIIDETIMKLPLLEPLAPQGEIELEINFVVVLPELFVRMGYSGNDFMIGQWFPKMAVLEEDGDWNAHQYHFNSEFFADFGTYHVCITVPKQYVVGATGYLVEKREKPDTSLTFVFHAEDVHDFAWAASPNYRISKKTVDGVDLSFFYKPEHQESVEKIMNYAEFALGFYGSIFGEYHYDHFTMVDTKVGLAGGAMEYPAFITVSPSRLPQDKIRADALTVFHEIAHQWWYGMVASNEFEEAWLDEGFAVYSERRALEERFGKEANIIDMWGLKVSDLDHARLGNLLDLQSDPVVKNSWEFRNYPSYLSRVYFKASLVLETLRNYLGQEKMDQVLKEYFRRYKFKHPNTEDFIQVVNEVTEEDFTAFFEQLLFGTGYCDYEVVSIESISIGPGDEKDRYATEVQLRRLGEVVIPMDVEIKLEDGQRIRKFWEGKERWYKIELKTDAKIRSATIDPHDKNVVDINFNNNSLSDESNDPVLMKMSAQCLFGLENLIDLLTCF
jgi:hypothetical protein